MTQTYTQVAQEHIRLQAERKPLPAKLDRRDYDNYQEWIDDKNRLKEINNRISELERMLNEWGVL